MKKIYLSLMTAATMLLIASSCSQEEDFTPSTKETMTTFKVKLEGNAQSRTAGDGQTVKHLYYEVYQGSEEKRKKVLDNLGTDANAEAVTIDGGLATVEMPLMKGEYYDLIFWAQADDAIYIADNLQNISVNYNAPKSNQEAYDAFFYGKEGFRVSGNVETIELHRPFGQLNIGTTYNEDKENPGDWQVAKEMISGEVPPVTESQIKVTGLANRFNALKHIAFVEEGTQVGQVTFEMEQLVGMNLTEAKYVGETFEIKKDGTETEEYQNLSMNYLLVPTNMGEDKISHKGNVDIVASFKRGDQDLFNVDVPNVPLQRNWRTNIVGELLAADKTFEVIIVPDFWGDEIYPDNQLENLYMAAAIGGEVTLTENVVLPTPLNVKSDMTINLNGHTISNTTDLWKDTDDINDWSLISVQNGSTLTIKGEGELKAKENDCYAVDVRDGSTVNIEGGKYVGNISAVYVHSGIANIKGGEFSIQQTGANGSYEYTLNCLDENYNNETAKIVVTGGKFYKFNPDACKAEGAGTDFVSEGYDAKTDGDWTTVRGHVVDIILHEDYAEVYTAEGLLNFVNIVSQADNHGKNGYNLNLMQNIEMPLLTIEKDAEGNYVFTDTPITFDENGVPSGSNWIPICGEITVNNDKITDLTEGFNGCIDGNGITISNLYINKETAFTGLVGFMYDNGMIKNLTIANSFIKGSSYTGVVGGRSQHGSRIENVHVVNSTIMGTSQVGGIVGYNYRREGGKNNYQEEIAYVKNCTTDNKTKVEGTTNVGGICGTNYGAVIVNCVNNADVTAGTNVGGIVGYSRDYWSNNDATTVADAYVMACYSTDEATVRATDNGGCAGGIVGHTLADTNNHPHTKHYVVACHSASHVEGAYNGAIIGKVEQTATIVASYANANLVGTGTPDLQESNQYEAAAGINENIVNNMNIAIDIFNAQNAEGIKCEYKWEWVNGKWPKLVTTGNN